MAKSVRNASNAVARTVYASLAQDAHHREVAEAFYGGNLSKAFLARFDDVDNLFDIPAFLRPRIVAAAKAANLSLRDYVIKVFTEHALGLPATTDEKPEPRKPARK
jgi:hypothetical protein